MIVGNAGRGEEKKDKAGYAGDGGDQQRATKYRTRKMILAVLMHKWIMLPDWVEVSMREQQKLAAPSQQPPRVDDDAKMMDQEEADQQQHEDGVGKKKKGADAGDGSASSEQKKDLPKPFFLEESL